MSSVRARRALGLSLVARAVPPYSPTMPTVALVVIVAVAIALLGPGAYSLDSYLFGRREIVIAARGHSPGHSTGTVTGDSQP